jgi:imidazolonepropionase
MPQALRRASSRNSYEPARSGRQSLDAQKEDAVNGDITIAHAASLVRVKDAKRPRVGRAQGELDIIHDGALAVRGGVIVAVGGSEEVLRAYGDDAPVLDATGKTVLPGLVECHSHPIFAGARHWEYVRRLEGASGREIRAEGGGIWSTIMNTRQAGDEELLGNVARAFEQIAAGGVTTLEVKSGYGLDTEGELRLLRLLRQAAGHTPMDIVFTFLGAHIAPQDGRSADAFVDVVKNEMLPAVLAQGIAESQDISCENGDFSAAQARELIDVSISLGLPVRIHADASSDSRGWRTAVEGRALSADHLTYTPDSEIDAVGATATVAVLLPVAEQFYLDERRANGRLFIKNNVPVAVATDYCSTFQATSLPLTIAQACSWFRLTPAEAIVGATLNAAYALGKSHDRGSLDVGKRGDVTIFDCEHPNQLGTAIGAPLVDVSLSRGRVVWKAGK